VSAAKRGSSCSSRTNRPPCGAAVCYGQSVGQLAICAWVPSPATTEGRCCRGTSVSRLDSGAGRRVHLIRSVLGWPVKKKIFGLGFAVAELTSARLIDCKTKTGKNTVFCDFADWPELSPIIGCVKWAVVWRKPCANPGWHSQSHRASLISPDFTNHTKTE